MNDMAMKRPVLKRRLGITLLKLIMSAAILALILITKTSLKDILQTLGKVRLSWLVPAFSLHAIGLFASAYRWQILAKAQGDIIPLGYLMKSYLVGSFFNNFLPSSFGGDVVRIWDGSRYSKSLLKSSAIVAVERITGLIVLFLFALIASLFRLDMAHDIPVIWFSLAFGLAGLVLIILFLTPVFGSLLRHARHARILNKPAQKALSFRETVLHYRKEKGAFLHASLWALALQMNVVFYFFLIGKAFRLDIRFLDYFIVIPIVLIVQIIPITINGLGLREGSYIEIFKYYAIPAQTAFSFSLVDVGFRLILGVAGGIIYVSRK